MSRLQIYDITDELILPVVTNDDLLAADEYLADLCISVGADISNVPTPLPYRLKRLLVAFVCKEACARKAGGALGTAYKGQETSDKWTQKLPYFTKQLSDYEAGVNYELVTGQKIKQQYGTISLSRG